MHYYISLTSKCNLSCKYCHGKSIDDFMDYEESKKYDFNIPINSNVKINELKNLSKNESDFKLTFYGGEPLLKIDMIKNIMDNVDAKEYMIQTNGQNLDKLPFKYTNKLSTILVSIDGTREHTDERRGEGVYDKVVSNVKEIINNGYKGEIIARITVDETCDIYENVTYLYNNSDFSFSSIHWQIDAQFFGADYKTRNFKEWLENDYMPNLKKLIHWWYNTIEEQKIVPRIYPFVGITYSLLTGEVSPMRCGAGHSCLGIQTDGKIVSCPITAGYKPLYMGDVRTSSFKEIVDNKIEPDGQCLECSVKNLCGGRCLYANKTQLWGEKGYDEVCESVVFLIESLREILPNIKKLINNGQLKIEDFDYPRYNGCEIIP